MVDLSSSHSPPIRLQLIESPAKFKKLFKGVMEIIYHVHLTKTDFENIKHLQLIQVCFKAPATALSPTKQPHTLNPLTLDGGRWKKT